MSTAANVRGRGSNRFYTIVGDPIYEIPKKSGVGMKRPNINDMIENSWVPSVTTVLRTIHKPALQDWLIEQAVLAVMTTPRLPDETVDTFVNRVLKVERVQDQTADKAADMGTAIHEAIEHALSGEKYHEVFRPYVVPVLDILDHFGKKVWSEKVLVGEGYAGRSDYLGQNNSFRTLVDFKTTGEPPKKEAYEEHVMQVAAYAKALEPSPNLHTQTAIVYIGTKNPGQVIYFTQENWLQNYERGFKPCLDLWRFMNGVA